MIIGIDISPACRKEKTGIEWYAWHVTRGLLARKANDIEYRLYSDVSCEDSFDADMRALSWPSRYFWPELRESIEILAHAPDLLFVPARALPLALPKKVVSTIHDVGFIPYPDERKALSREYLLRTSRWAALRADRIITVSEFAKQEIIKYFNIDPQKIVVTHLGYDRERYVPAKEISKAQPFILCLGRRERRKNLLALVKAYEELHRRFDTLTPRLMIVGPPGHHAAEIDHAIAGSPACKKITVRDWVSEDEKIRLLQHALCLLQPSVYEGFGLPVIEAQACGTPVVCSNAASLPEIAGDGALFFDPHIPEDIAEKVVSVIGNETLREELSKKGLRNAERFSWHMTTEKTGEILQNVLCQ
ncbi:glycosyltransferase family 4 protein [Candidatus Uhrbacteria bacterium]|nr:glycosyltransferase family 4 protein [Candidatus Uhrbacteria bacterium]